MTESWLMRVWEKWIRIKLHYICSYEREETKMLDISYTSLQNVCFLPNYDS